MGDFQPLISVVVPNYNHADMLQRTLDGVFSQSYQNWEMILADDASTDGSREIILVNAARDRRIRPHIAEKNRGVCGNLNAALEQIQGDYYVVPASDDFISSPDFFADAVEGFEQRPQAGVFAGLSSIVDMATLKEEFVFGRAPAEGFYEGRDALRCYLAYALDMHGACVIMRSDYVKSHRYDLDLGPTADSALFISAAANLGVIFRKKIYVTVTKSETNYSRGTSVNHHYLFENKLKQWIPYWQEMEREFEEWRFSKLLFFICSVISIRKEGLEEEIARILHDVMRFYPVELARSSRKEAMVVLAKRLREIVQEPALRDQIPQFVRIIDVVLRPFYGREK